MRVVLDPRTRVLDGGRLLVGGAPLTVQRLRRPVAEVVDGTTHDTALGRRWLATGLGLPVPGPTDAVAADQLTVVVPVRDRPAQLARCRAALHPLRVLVVDDASAVAVPGALRLDTNLGPAGARNAGLHAVTTPYVAFVDSDVEVRADDLLRLAAHLADPAVAAVAPRVRGRRTGTGTGTAWWQRYDAAFSALDLGPRPAQVRPGGQVAYLPSACLVARTSALGTGFDAELRLGEDVDLVWRLLAAGHQVRYDPSVVVAHDTRPSLGAWLRQSYDYGTSAAPLAARHGRAVAPAVLAPASGLAVAAMLVRGGSGRWGAAAAVSVWATTTRRLAGTLPPRDAAFLAASGLGWTVRQEASLALRHWWPLAALAGTTRSGRRLLVSAILVDAAVALADRRGLDATTRLVGRRLTDLAYGAGVWSGAARARSLASLRPRRTAAPAVPRQARGRSLPAADQPGSRSALA